MTTKPGTKTVIADGKVACGACGSTQFKYEESHPSERKMVSNDADGLAFWGDFEWFDGDDDPGVVCAGCGAHADYDGKVEFL